MPIRRIIDATRSPERDALTPQQIPQHPTARERVIKVQFVDPAHDRQIGGRHGAGVVIQAATAEPQQLRLPCQRQVMAPLDHRFALNSPALPSAPDKKSFSSVSSPIFACSVFRSTLGAPSLAVEPEPNNPEAPSSSCAFQAVTWVGCTSYSCASSASVFSPLIAANATLALNAGLWFRRVRLDMSAPDPRQSSPRSGRKSTYRTVQICPATSGVTRFLWRDIEPYLGDVTPYESMEAHSKVSELATTGFQIWGIPSGALRVLDPMRTGDFLMLLESTDFRYVGQVIHRFVQPNYGLSRRIWGEERFPLIILLQGELISYGWDRFSRRHSKFDPKYHMRGNTMRLSDERVATSDFEVRKSSSYQLSSRPREYAYGDQEADFRTFANNLEVHLRLVKARAEQQAFRSSVLLKQGVGCAVCGIDFPEVLDAAHLIPKEHNGSDDYRNGLALCALHHRMFDAGMFEIDPRTLNICPVAPHTLEVLKIVKFDVTHLLAKPHRTALESGDGSTRDSMR